MAIKPRFNDAQLDKFNERTDRQVGRIYLIWLAGIVVGAIQLRPDRVTYSGISYVVDSPEKLQGVIFVGCVVYYLALLGVSLLHHLQFTTSAASAIKRHMIYSAALRDKKTLLGLGYAKVRTIVFSARFQFFLTATLAVLIVCFPLLHILIFQQRSFLVGVDSIFRTVSFGDDGDINRNALAPLLIVGAFMLLWTSVVQSVLKWFFQKGLFGALYKHFFMLVTFAFIESRFRGEEFMTTFVRDAPLQIGIAALFTVPFLIASPFLLWVMGYKLVGKFVAWRTGKQKSP
ncbi:hypothetical protein [Bradyrhizobium sp. SZCCHNRI1073]|uniref:hypothetical protein n=1 Tax=Bradyrhizobium sp. SZCCHNRI1073 TaxID=3057280 RepID=UPI002915EBB1|nr:hypothetical protein [Bradyrhizobium sp. SZCCHNRI1073]